MLAMLRRRPFLTSVMTMLVATCWLGPAWGEQVIRLGGLRNVTATVSEPDGAYRVAVENPPARAEDFYGAIGNLEERADAAFKALAAQINEDDLLFSAEQDELRPVLKKTRVAVFESLKSAVARFDKRQEEARKEKEEQ